MQTNLSILLSQQHPPFSALILGHHTCPPLDDSGEDEIRCIDLRRVCNVVHSDYAGHSWGALIGRGDGLSGKMHPGRMHDCILQLRRQPGYYLDTDRKQAWSCYEVDDEYYVIDGHHRTVVGRFFMELNGIPPLIHGVHVTKVTRKEWTTALKRQQAWSDEIFGKDSQLGVFA